MSLTVKISRINFEEPQRSPDLKGRGVGWGGGGQNLPTNDL